MRQLSNKILYIVITVLVVVLYFSFTKRKEVNLVEVHTTDTVYVEITDTMTIREPVYIYKKVTDTIEVPVNGGTTISMPMETKFYSVPNTYNAWVSGYSPRLDSIRVYPKTKIKTIKDIREIKVYPKEYKLYVGAGIYSISDEIIPSISISLKTPKEWVFDATFSKYDGSIMYGVGVKTKIF